MRFWSVLVAFVLCSAAAQGGVLAQFKMSNKIGTIDVELFEQDKPVTVSNFVAYVKSGAWHDNILHRWLPGFVLQGGFYHVPHDPTLMTPWSVEPLEIAPFPAIPFEGGVGRFFSNVYGTIAMAREGTNINSAKRDWFFNLKDNVHLDTQDGGYTVFGRTLRGTNILNRFNQPAGSTNIYYYPPPPPDFPVYSEDRMNVFWLNVDITLLTVQIQQVSGGNQISWNSVEGRPNIVEFARASPPVWETAEAVTGTGAPMSVVNNPGRDTLRYYRVRIDYSN